MFLVSYKIFRYQLIFGSKAHDDVTLHDLVDDKILRTFFMQGNSSDINVLSIFTQSKGHNTFGRAKNVFNFNITKF